ncbi:RagB/SusD family nutrient uptake outer membrane protein [Flavobacterium sp.]|uniref:RagB/SusD family nutrient uptake outer membrane protein n=1 Tax=Flavobacterium sp. TaxID=239 RepID=UPI00286BC43D|nr:RagB/SusD family nutrient uptake outer membrane protein [Flavobacterium sp.]
MKNKNFIKAFTFLSVFTLSIGCSNLDEEILDGVSNSTTEINTAATLVSAYNGLREFQNQGQMFALDEMSTDALVGPTRGGDWDDNGSWRQIHNHTWGPDHVEVRGAWNTLLSNVYSCNLVIEKGGTPNQILEARFLRAFYYSNIIDLFGQVPYRPAGSDLVDNPKVWTRAEATTFVISELESILPTLPARIASDPSKANKDAAHFLLAKLYLNKGVYLAGNAVGPYTFAAADMTKVATNVDAMSNTLAANYWDNFAPTNNTSNEIVFSSKNSQGNSDGNIQSRWRMCNHYNQTPSGWNGFSTVSEYYNKFQAVDARAKYSNPTILSELGNPVGFLVGQLKNGKNTDAKGSPKDANGVAYTNIPAGSLNLQDRTGKPLIFTQNVTLITGGNTLETAGIRGIKYIPDVSNIEKPENDYVLMRYSDALLMKAEAILRGGTGSASTILADLAARSGVTAAPNTLDGIYAERGRELWWEGYRRNDMIRFGKFLNQRELKPYTSNSKYILYPIPADALFNSNLKQNPGY